MLSWLQLKNKPSFFFFPPKEVAFSVVSGYFATWLFSSSEIDFDANGSFLCKKDTSSIGGIDPIKSQIPHRAAQGRKKCQKYLTNSFRIALSEIKELGVYTDMNVCSALINKGKYNGQDIINAICICKALLKITGFHK